MTRSEAVMPAPTGAAVPDLREPVHFEGFVSAHSGVVLRLCTRLLRDRFAAEDACQETFTAAWRQRENLRPNRAWLLRVATNKCLDELRRRARHRDSALDEDMEGEPARLASARPTPEAAVLSAHARGVLEDALARLPRAQRIAVILADVEDWPYAEIARACGVCVGTVKSRVFRGRYALRELLRDAGVRLT